MPSLTTRTHSNAKGPRTRNPPNTSRAPLTQQQRKEKKEENDERREEIDAAVDAWFEGAVKHAGELATRFNKRPRYFLDVFFGGGARMVSQQTKTNAHKAFLHFKSEEARDDGRVMSLLDIQKDNKDEYDKMTAEEREEIIAEYDDEKKSTHLRRPTPRSRIADVANTVRNLRQLIEGLQRRVGVEAFFCIVRNTPDYSMAPQWYFTRQEMEQYMSLAVAKRTWDTARVGTKLEAFAVAGCDMLSVYTTAKSKVEYLKSDIRDRLTRSLITVTGQQNAIIHWENFEEKTVLHYGVDLVGWTYEKIVNPSHLSSALGPLQDLLSALKNESCQFVKLTRDDKQARQALFDSKVSNGEVQPATRKRRSDAGTKRSGPNKRRRVNDENVPPSKSADIVDGDE